MSKAAGDTDVFVFDTNDNRSNGGSNGINNEKNSEKPEDSSQINLIAEEKLEDPEIELNNVGDEAVLLRELDILSEAQLVERIKEVEQWSYQLGLLETHELQRGRVLNVLGDER